LTAALAIAGLDFAYGGRSALADISLSIQPGETVVLLGPNGAGKTTLFSLVCGLFTARTGSIAIAGRDLGKTGAAALKPLGIVFQAQTLDLDLTVRQNLRYFCALRGMARREADARIGEELSRFDMTDRLGEKIRKLNGGHRRRVEIARAVLHRPDLLLLDEPTVGLDIATRRGLIAHLHGMAASGRALLWATHLIDEVEQGDRVLVLHQGRLVGDGTPAQLVAQTQSRDLGEAYARLTGPDTSRD
jgi:ABC-2 type transport system ATP-binding protein